jgi:hypothetical protein
MPLAKVKQVRKNKKKYARRQAEPQAGAIWPRSRRELLMRRVVRRHAGRTGTDEQWSRQNRFAALPQIWGKGWFIAMRISRNFTYEKLLGSSSSGGRASPARMDVGPAQAPEPSRKASH